MACLFRVADGYGFHMMMFFQTQRIMKNQQSRT
jgi:hypothetical protein